MAVISKEKILSFDLFLKAFEEKKTKDGKTFYESEFDLDNLDPKNQIYENIKGNTLPGIIAFSFYTGSYFMMFFIIFILSIFASSIEYLAFKLSYNNLIFSSLIGQIIAFRFTHFGYLPNQSYLLFGTIILTILFVYVLKLFNNKTFTIK